MRGNALRRDDRANPKLLIMSGLVVVALTTMLIVHVPERPPSRRESKPASRYDELDGLESQWSEVLSNLMPTNVDVRCCGRHQPSETPVKATWQRACKVQETARCGPTWAPFERSSSSMFQKEVGPR